MKLLTYSDTTKMRELEEMFREQPELMDADVNELAERMVPRELPVRRYQLTQCVQDLQVAKMMVGWTTASKGLKSALDTLSELNT